MTNLDKKISTWGKIREERICSAKIYLIFMEKKVILLKLALWAHVAKMYAIKYILNLCNFIGNS